MNRSFTASRISNDNVLFPPTIIFSDEGVTIKSPALLHKNTEFIPYSGIASVLLHTPLVGFSSITFHAFGHAIKVHGFYKNEVKEMKEIVESMR